MRRTSSSHGGERLLYILDEPTTGLHFDDIAKLLAAFRKLLEAGHTLLVIEHNLDVIKTADYIIDLGPEGGEEGGQVVATGTPEQVAQVEASHTGRDLRDVLATGRSHAYARAEPIGRAPASGRRVSSHARLLRRGRRSTVAADLLGKVLVHDTRAGVAAGMIVETEAYIGEDDPACHAAPGPTRATRRSTGRPGVAYVYLNYGIHYLVNAVTEAKGIAGGGADSRARAARRRRADAASRGRRTAPRDRPSHDSVSRARQPDAGARHHARRQPARSHERAACDRRSGPAVGRLQLGPRIGIRVGVERHGAAGWKGIVRVGASRRA